MSQPERQTQQVERSLLTAKGFAEVPLLDAFAENNLLELNWVLPDEQFVNWVNGLAQKEAEGRTPFENVAVFETGSKGDLITTDFGKTGIIKRKPQDLTVEVGKPYLLRQIRDTQPGKRQGAWLLSVIREARYEDYLPYLQAKAAGSDGRRFCQVFFYNGGQDRLIGSMRILPDGGENWGEDDKNVRINDRLPEEIRDRVADGQTWIGEIKELPRCYLFKPHVPVSHWTKFRVRMDSGRPVVMQQEFAGLEAWRESASMPIDSPLMVAEYLSILPPTQQAILARLWNIHWSREAKRREEEATIEEHRGLAQISAWEGYKKGTIGVERDALATDANEVGETPISKKKAVWVHGKKRPERFLIDPTVPAEVALREYEGNLSAYTAAEWLGIMEDDQKLLEYLINQEGIRLQAGLLSGVRPDRICIDVAGLAQTEAYRPNGNPWGREPIAKDQFGEEYGEDIGEFENEFIKIVLQFLPSLYEKTTGIQDEVAVNGWLPEMSYHVGYLLEDATVDFKGEVQKLPEHIKERILRIVEEKIAELRHPDWLDLEEGESVRWLAGKKWEAPVVGTTTSVEREVFEKI